MTKQAQTSRNDQKTIAKRPETTQNYKIGEISNFLLAFIFQTSSPNAQIWVFWAKKYQLFNLFNKICLYPILKMLISSLTLFFQICLAQISIWNKLVSHLKFEHFGPETVNLLILIKFCTRHLLSVVLSSLVPRLQKPIQCLRFATCLENGFSFFCKNLKILWPQLLIFEDAYYKCDIKIIQAYSKPHNFKILRNGMNEKAGFEIILKRSM